MMMRSPVLVYTSRLLMLLPPCLQIGMMHFPFLGIHPSLLWFGVLVMMRFCFSALCLLVPPTLSVSVFAPILPRRLVADALLGMALIGLLCLDHLEYPVFLPVTRLENCQRNPTSWGCSC
jgi:hypothetical protein